MIDKDNHLSKDTPTGSKTSPCLFLHCWHLTAGAASTWEWARHSIKFHIALVSVMTHLIRYREGSTLFSVRALKSLGVYSPLGVFLLHSWWQLTEISISKRPSQWTEAHNIWEQELTPWNIPEAPVLGFWSTPIKSDWQQYSAVHITQVILLGARIKKRPLKTDNSCVTGLQEDRSQLSMVFLIIFSGSFASFHTPLALFKPTLFKPLHCVCIRFLLLSRTHQFCKWNAQIV